MTYTTQKQVRAAFWRYFHEGQVWSGELIRRPKRLKDGDYPPDVRVIFVEYVDELARNGDISEALAQRVTL